MISTRLIAAATLLAAAIPTFGAASRQHPVVVTDPSGNPVTVVAVGDEHARHYVRLDDGSAVRWIKSEGSLKSFTPLDRLDATRQSGRRQAQRRITTFPTMGENHFLVVLVEFADQKFSIDNPAAEMSAMFNAPGYDTLGGTGSVRDYYMDCSAGQFAPTFDVVGPVVMEHNVEFYGSGSDDSAAGMMVVEACKALDGVIDFSLYDHDGNGEVDSVYFIYAGKGEADGGAPETIWPHSWNLSDQGRELTLDGVAIQGYACSPELDGSAKLNGMGTPCHEFAHVLGLPDLYCTNSYVSCLHPYDFSLMARGNYLNDGRTPPALSAYERYELGWLKPRELTHPATVCLQPVSTDNSACRIATERTNEYFMLENRQPTGWDRYLPAHGMLVWHIDYSPDIWDRNRVNATPAHQYVDIVEANGASDYTHPAGFTFPGASNVTSLTAQTRPALVSWSGKAIDLPVTDIAERSDGTVTFNVAGGKADVGVATALEAVDMGMTGFTLRWTAAPHALSHTVSLTAVDEDGNSLGRPVETTVPDGATSYTFSGLTPGSIYSVQVRGADLYENGPWSEPLTVTMPEPTFEYLRPMSAEATEIGHDRFTARWQPLDGAVRYRLTINPRIRGKETLETADFTDKKLPDGYSTTSKVWVSIAGNYGASAPALRLGADNDCLTTAFSDSKASSIRFWIKTQNPDPDARVIVEEIYPDESSEPQVIASFTPQAGIATVMFENETPLRGTASALRIRFSKAGKCTVNIDDVTVGYGGALRDDTANAILRTAEGGTTTSLLIDGLNASAPYSYTVTGESADGLLSLPSQPVTFTTTAMSGIPGPLTAPADAPVDIYTTNGVLLLKAVTIPQARQLLPSGLYIAGSRLIAL